MKKNLLISLVATLLSNAVLAQSTETQTESTPKPAAGSEKKDQDFTPSSEITGDSAVAFPVDI